MKIFLLCCLLATPAFSEPNYITFPSDIDWVTQRSERFEIIFRRGQDRMAARALAAAEKARLLLEPIFPEHPEKVYVVLADFHDTTNGYALNFPYSHIVLFASPPDNGALSSLDQWFESVVLHEYVHILHLYPANGLWRVARAIFGNIIVPNGLLPGHLHEGLATFLETELTRGGRGRSSEFSMYRRMAVEEGAWGHDFTSLDRLSGTASEWPYGTSAYFFGYSLYEELWKRKGRAGIRDLTLGYSDNWPFFINTPLQDVYGVDYPTLWRGLFDDSTLKVKQEIAEVRKTPLSELTFLTQSRASKWDLAFAENGKRFAMRVSDPEEGSRLEIRRTDNQGLIESVRLTGHPTNGICFGNQNGGRYLAYIEAGGAHRYDTNRLVVRSLADKENFIVRLQGGETLRPLFLGCNRDISRLFVFQEIAGRGEIREIEWKSQAPELGRVLRRWATPEGSYVTSLMGTGRVLFTLREGLETRILDWTEATPREVFRTAGHFFALSPGDSTDEVFAIGDIEGREEVWHLHLARQKLTKVLGLLGGTNSYARVGKEWWLTAYRHGGYDLAKATLVKAPPREPAVVANTEPPTPPPTLSTVEDYSPWGTLYPRTWVPSILFVADGLQAGFWIPGFDLSQRHNYGLMAGYDTRGIAFGELDYSYRFGLESYWDASIYSFPNYLIRARLLQERWGGSVGMGTQVPGLDLGAKLSFLFRRSEATRADIGRQSVGVGLDLARSFGVKSRPLGISPYTGTQIAASYAIFPRLLASTDYYFTTTAGADQYLEAPWARNHVFYAGAKIGFTEGTSFDNSYFQGGGEILFNLARGNFLNRGFQAGTFLARRLFTLNLEYRFPLWRVDRGVNLLPFFLRNVHGALVWDATSMGSGVLGARRRDLFRVFYHSAGVELKSDWTLSYYLPAQFRMGAYHGFGPYGEAFYYTFGLDASL